MACGSQQTDLVIDGKQVMTNLYLAPFPRPATSLVADHPYEQGHKGWQVCTLPLPRLSEDCEQAVLQDILRTAAVHEMLSGTMRWQQVSQQEACTP